MYAKCGSIDVARQVFDRLLERHIVSWNAMIAGYAQNGNASEALALYQAMLLGKVKPNPVTVVSALRVCAQLADLEEGKGIHDYIVRDKFVSDVFVETALINMYAKCGSLEVARQLFDKMSKKDIVSWNAMIAGYAQSGRANEAMTIFHQMKLANVKPNRATIVSMLPACGDLAALEEGKEIHDYVVRNNLQSDVLVQNSLVTMYMRCGCLEIGQQVFDQMLTRDLVSWNAVIAGFAQNGHAIEALNLFCQM
jgi:pentatricopeptide repeat protein